MAMNFYTISVPPLISGLRNLSAVLKKGEAFADAKGISHDKFLSASLHEDMKPLPYQIQRVSDTAKGFATRLEAITPVSMPDDETTFEELQARISKTIDVLESVKESDLVGKEGKAVQMKIASAEINFTGLSYLQQFVLPNFYFHATTAYGILRKEGVDVGKRDYLMGSNSKLGDS